MTRAIPQPPLPPQRPAMEGYSTPSRSAAEANSLRLAFVAERLSLLFRTGFRSEDLLKPCFSLARGIDYALSNNDVPSIVSRLPSLVKQVYQYKSDTSLQSAITVLMISVKNACRNGWFHVADTDELIRMANELCSSFCMSTNITAEVSNALNTISKIIPRFYPHLKLGRLIVSFEAKPGYDILMADFLIQKYVPPEEKIGLFVAQTDDLETSSCLISPPQVSFLVNGKGVARRTNVFLDTGPQFPTDITKMLKYGTNIIQAVGYFSGNYIIAVSFMSKMTSSNGPVLKDYVQPVLAALAPDSEIIEGASRISLNCPISFRRINTPVKGHLCKHHQCFDYENFMEMNSRKPSWRCPCCNQPTSFIDLRIDQNMVKILQDVRVDITDVVISADESWKVVVECNGSTDQVHNGTLAEQKDGKIGGESYGISNALANVVDLTMDEDGRSDNNTYEAEDRKPFKDFQGFPVSESFPEQSLAHHATLMSQGVANQIGDDIWPRTWSAASASNGSSVPATTLDAHRVGTLESLVPNSVLNPVITDAISPALGRESTASLAVNQPAFTSQNVSQLAENIQRQPSRLGNSIISSEIERLPIPSQVNRAPIAIQALPAQTQASSSSQWTCSNILNSSSNIPSGSPSVSFQTVPSTTAIPGGFNTISSDIEMQQVSRASDIVSSLLQLHSVIQNWDQGCQYSLNSTLQQVVGLPAPTQACTRLPSDQQRVGSYRASLQPPSDYQNPHHQLVNLRGRQTMSQCTNTLPQSSCSPSVQVQQALQNDVGVAAGSSVNHHNQLLAARRASQLARLQSVHPFASGAGSSFPMTADSLRLMGGEQLQNMVEGPLAVSRTERLPELPSEHNWRPTGRMRGSLMGSAYSAALNHHLVQPSQQIPARPPTPSTVATSDQLPVLISNSINARGSLVQQANWRYSDLGN